RATQNRIGEAQTLLAVSDLQRRQRRYVEARNDIEKAREIFQSLDLAYGQSRAPFYFGMVTGDAGDFPAAVQFFEDALTQSRQLGNRDIEASVQINLGVAYERLGQRIKALEYYQRSHDVYEESGNELLAAQQEANTAQLLVDFGTNQADALRR